MRHVHIIHCHAEVGHEKVYSDIDSPSSSLHSPLVVCMLVEVQRWHQRRLSHSDECSVQWPPLDLGPSGVRDTQSTGYCAHTIIGRIWVREWHSMV